MIIGLLIQNGIGAGCGAETSSRHTAQTAQKLRIDLPFAAGLIGVDLKLERIKIGVCLAHKQYGEQQYHSPYPDPPIPLGNEWTTAGSGLRMSLAFGGRVEIEISSIDTLFDSA